MYFVFYFISSNYKNVNKCVNRLFFGGYLPINIESIRIMNTMENFEEMVRALNHLDAFLSGDDLVDGYGITEKHVKIIQILFSKFLSESDKMDQRIDDDYMLSCFKCFLEYKKNIEINPDFDKYYGSKQELVNIVMNEMKFVTVNGASKRGH